jgi:hypothetical protein
MPAAAWNFLVYAIADDPKQHAQFTDAIAQMRSALTGGDCKVVVQLHTKTSTTRHWLAAGKRPRVEHVHGGGAANPDALTAFIDAAHRSRPAEATALVLLGHGNGLDDIHTPLTRPDPGATANAMLAPAPLADVFDRTPSNHNLAAVGRYERTGGSPVSVRKWRARLSRDPRTGEHLRNVDLRKAIARSLQKRVQVLGLNACWMATLEVEYELRSVAEIQIASQTYASPWPYGPIVAALAYAPAPSPAAVASAIVAAVRDDRRDDTVSAIESGVLAAFVAAFDLLAKRARALVEADWEAIAKVVGGEAQRVEDPYQVDLRSLIEALARHDGKARAAAGEALARLTELILDAAAGSNHPGVHGLSILCPMTTDLDLVDAYRGLQFRELAWVGFLRAYQAKLTSQRGR